MRKKLKGSALLWSVCALLIVAFVLTGLLAINKSYAEEEINNVASRRAEYLARSGVELTVNLIEKGELRQISEISSSNDYGKKYKNREAEITFELDEPVTVNISKSGDEIILIKYDASSGNMRYTMCAVMNYDTIKKCWEFEGYVKY